ncbi:MAG: hypothetical protein QXJ75_03765 [Candidatus Bathyarchaeia archaeon]
MPSMWKNMFSSALWTAVTVYACRFPSLNFRRVMNAIDRVIKGFETKLEETKRHPYISADTLNSMRIFKVKYYTYAAFLAALSSYPILGSVATEEHIYASIFAKTAMVASIKLLDNINDSFQSFNEAVESQVRYQRALATGILPSEAEEDLGWVSRAENTAHLIASWAHGLIASACSKSKMFNLFLDDLYEYIDGQIASFCQRRDRYSVDTMSLNDFLHKVSSKCFGKIWVDIDFCFLEKSVEELDANEEEAALLVNRSLDLIFKSLLFYDDVTDFDEDVKNHIINSTMILGIDLGKISAEELFGDKDVLHTKLESKGVFNDAFALGNILYLKGVECLVEAKKYTRLMDIDALIFCARVLRLFLLRKTFLNGNGLDLRMIIRSLEPLAKLKASIPEYLKAYELAEELGAKARGIKALKQADNKRALLVS